MSKHFLSMKIKDGGSVNHGSSQIQVIILFLSTNKQERPSYSDIEGLKKLSF